MKRKLFHQVIEKKDFILISVRMMIQLKFKDAFVFNTYMNIKIDRI